MRKSLAVVGLFAVVFFALGFRVVHPQGGLQSVMGSAKSSLVIYKNGGQAITGDKVLVPIKDQGIHLGVVKSAKTGTADVDTGAAFVRVKQSEIKGELVAVIPFFGIPLGWVGL